ncbi:caldesmon-like isoform X2 [Prorops nasuta]|uniref:caldesmon-like isoform X2 n=1 Tax=Prorops nasuta TaxID=863751 RepID=UPI0034CD70E8
MAESKPEISIGSKEAATEKSETVMDRDSTKETDNKSGENGLNESITKIQSISEKALNINVASGAQDDEKNGIATTNEKPTEIKVNNDKNEKNIETVNKPNIEVGDSRVRKEVAETEEVTKPESANIVAIISEEEAKLNEILKVVHEGLDIKDFQKQEIVSKVVRATEITKKDNEVENKVEVIEDSCNQEKKLEEVEDIINKTVENAHCKVKEEKLKVSELKGEEAKHKTKDVNKTLIEKEDKDDKKEEVRKEKKKVKKREEKKDDIKAVREKGQKKRVEEQEEKETETKKEVDEVQEVIGNAADQSELGIVGPPTAVSDLISDAELQTESVLPTEEKVQDHVAEWVENTVKQESLKLTEEEVEEIEQRQEIGKNGLKEKRSRRRKMSESVSLPSRKSQRIISNIIKRSIRCLNKMHAMEGGAAGNGKKLENEKLRVGDVDHPVSPKVPQSQQNGAALPEETAVATADRLRTTSIKKEPVDKDEDQKPHQKLLTRSQKDESSTRKRKANDSHQLSTNGSSGPAGKKSCLEQREQFISSLVGSDKVSPEELAARADQLRAEVQALDELARAKEMEWNEILSMRKLKEEAYLRLERKRQVIGFMADNGQISDTMPLASLTLGVKWERSSTPVPKDRNFGSKEDITDEMSRGALVHKREKHSKSSSQRHSTQSKQGNDGRKQNEALNPENRQIGEGRQGAIVDVKSIIADYRLRHPETVPRRMRNSVNVGLGTGGAMMETGQNVDSRPSSTDSCKSNPNVNDSNNSMSFKDVLVQFAKLSQQQGEPVKTPQNYPDVTLHPVAPSPVPQSAPQQSGSLLHGILTKSQSPRPTTFSPTLARLLTAPERERNTPTMANLPQQNTTTQHLLQAYQGSNPVSISDLLSSSKARTEITITPVVSAPVQSHSNNLINVDDVEEETAIIEDRESRISGSGRDSRNDRDTPPRCQGCHDRAAQFVCAGCGNQWYCSRECQVAAWDEHSEVCSG